VFCSLPPHNGTMSFQELCASLLEGEPTSPYPPAPPPSQVPQTPEETSSARKTKKMAPKAKSTNVYVVIADGTLSSAFATLEAANAYVEECHPQEIEVTVEALTLEGGSITIDAPPNPAKSTKVVAASDGGAVAEPAKTKPKKATPAPATAENGTASTAKPKAKAKSKDDKLPENIKQLLNGEGDTLDGQSVMVTGTFPKLGRKNVVKLVENYGGDLKPELRKATNLVVVGDDLGSKK
jgi:NAD-dependent DNA ligase